MRETTRVVYMIHLFMLLLAAAIAAAVYVSLVKAPEAKEANVAMARP